MTLRMFWLPWRSLMAQSSLIDFSSPGGFEPLGQKKGQCHNDGEKKETGPSRRRGPTVAREGRHASFRAWRTPTPCWPPPGRLGHGGNQHRGLGMTLFGVNT